MRILTPIIILIVIALGCANSNKANKSLESNSLNKSSPSLETSSKLFPAQDVCNYPTKASIPRLRELAGGEWKESIIDGESLGFGCMSGKYSQKEVKLFEDSPFIVQIEYAVMGDKQGARYLVIDYWVDLARVVPNEPKLRAEYVTFLDDLTKSSLKQPLPEQVKKKILDLSSFANTGVANEDRFDLGEGYIIISRNRNPNNSIIFVKTHIFADRSLKE